MIHETTVGQAAGMLMAYTRYLATVEPDEDDGKDPAAAALGRKGGLKGGKARAAKMTPEERAESARKAAQARWAKRSAS